MLEKGGREENDKLVCVKRKFERKQKWPERIRKPVRKGGEEYGKKVQRKHKGKKGLESQ